MDTQREQGLQKSFNQSEEIENFRKELQERKRRFVIDIDGVITQKQEGINYKEALPNQKMISVINQLYQQGHEIVLFTARGYVTGIDWRGITEEQLANWGVLYHELHFGKPNADYYVDDRMLDMGLLLELSGESKQGEDGNYRIESRGDNESSSCSEF